MPRRSPRTPGSFVYGPENVTFFVEDMIWYVLARNGVDLELRRSEHMEQLRAVAMYTFCPSIGDAVVFVTHELRRRIMDEVNNVWRYVRTIRPAVRGEVLHCNLVILGMRILGGRAPAYIFVVMAIISQLCVFFARRQGLNVLIGYAVSALEYIFNHIMRGGFPRTLMVITSLALRWRIECPSMLS